MIAVDGSKIEAILTLVGAPKPSAKGRQEVAALEKWLGKPIPTESKAFLLRKLDLWGPNTDHPKVKDTSWLGKLPDVGAWLEQLGKPYEGYLQAVHHFQGLYPIGCQINRGDFMCAHLVLEPYGGKSLGGVMYYDEREIGTWGGSVSAFLLQELAKFWEEYDGSSEEGEEVDITGLRDCFVFDRYDPKKKPPPAAKLPPKLEKAWQAHWRWRLDRRGRWWVSSFLGGGDPGRFVSALPTEAEWEAEKAGVGKTHHEGMYWLLAHWLLGNEEELGVACSLAKKNPSKLVAEVSKHVQKNALPKAQKKNLDRLLVKVRESTR